MKTLRTFFTVIISLAFLTTYAQGDISGTILYHSEDGAPLPEVELQLFNADGEYVATSFTNDEGEYLFEDLEIGDYYIEASYDAEAGGATMQDAVMIMLHLMGVHELEGIEYLAADVDADGEITWDDHALVLLHFFTGEPFPAGDWVFEDIEHNIGDKEGGDDGDGGGNDNLGSSAGDVAGTWEPGQRDRRIAEAEYTPHSLVPQENTTLSVTASNNMTLTGAGIAIQYPASLVDVSNVTTPLQDAEVRIQNGQIMLAWNSANSVTLNKGEELLTMETTLLSETGETIRFTLGQKTSFAGENGSPVKNAKLNLPEMKQSQAMKINSLAPNPVFHEATLNFYMNRGGTAKVSLTDLSGKKVRTIESSQFSQG
ncbi:MAG: carboxypeptidase regulatory-like domain-containing protein, partial [Bacteroidota bacterium]